MQGTIKYAPYANKPLCVCY